MRRPRLARPVLGAGMDTGSATSRAAAAVAALDSLCLAVVVVDREGHTLYANPAAAREFRSGGCLTTDRDGLAAADLVERAVLRRTLRAILRPQDGDAEPELLELGAAAEDRRRTVLVAPLPTLPGAMVLVSDPDAPADRVRDVLRRLYGLTGAEATVASLLLEGCSLDELSDRLLIRHNTVRSHMKQIFSKVQVRSRGELMRVLLHGPARLARLVALPGDGAAPTGHRRATTGRVPAPRRTPTA